MCPECKAESACGAPAAGAFDEEPLALVLCQVCGNESYHDFKAGQSLEEARALCARAETLGSRRGGAALHRTADAFGLPAMHTGARGASASQRPMGLDPTGPLIVSGALPTSSLAPLTIALAYAPICFLQSIQRYTLRCERMRQFT